MYKMKEKFYWDVIGFLVEENTPVMHCKTEEEANWFLGILHGNGLMWSSKIPYSRENNWELYKYNTCYSFTDGTYCNLDYFDGNPSYAILECSDYMEYVGDDAYKSTTEGSDKMDSKKEFTKADLKDGMFVRYRDYYDGNIRMVFGDKLVGCEGYALINLYNDDLTEGTDKNLDIMEVYKVKIWSGLEFIEGCPGKYLTSIWKRSEPTEISNEDAVKKLKELTGEDYKIV